MGRGEGDWGERGVVVRESPEQRKAEGKTVGRREMGRDKGLTEVWGGETGR